MLQNVFRLLWATPNKTEKEKNRAPPLQTSKHHCFHQSLAETLPNHHKSKGKYL